MGSEMFRFMQNVFISENIMGPDEESEEFLSHVIKFLINSNPLKALHITFIILTVFSHCRVMMLQFATARKSKTLSCSVMIEMCWGGGESQRVK